MVAAEEEAIEAAGMAEATEAAATTVVADTAMVDTDMVVDTDMADACILTITLQPTMTTAIEDTRPTHGTVELVCGLPIMDTGTRVKELQVRPLCSLACIDQR